ncbi:MAG: PEP-CTERM sorting domain-containing protein [Aquabacterium sp.]|nr:MAG: PEP-CTERM sorting domain-containing protein [Aquabacterium sp.]
MNLHHILAAPLLGLCAATASAAPFSAVVSLGDSNSDTGNVHRLEPTLPVTPPYFDGRFSDGPVAVEHLAAQLGVPLVDLAWGGALTGQDNLLPGATVDLSGTGVLGQVDRLLAQQPVLDADALYVVWAGGNDFLLALADPAEAAANLATALQRLHDAGARSFLLPTLHDLADLPLVRGLGSRAVNLFGAMGDSFNDALRGHGADLASAWPDASLRLFDTDAVLAGLQAGGAFDGVDLDTPCVSGNFIQVSAVCADPRQHVYWDGTHLSAVVHAQLGQAMAAAVPEPSAFMLVAMGVAAAWLRVRGANQRRLSTCDTAASAAPACKSANCHSAPG